jgi:homoserine kinase
MLANEVMGLRLTNQELIDAALEMENHPDNISPALYGGAVASGVGEDGKSLIW